MLHITPQMGSRNILMSANRVQNEPETHAPTMMVHCEKKLIIHIQTQGYEGGSFRRVLFRLIYL